MSRPKTTETTPLTAKQQAFVDAYLGWTRFNGVKAAMAAYATTDYWTAASIAHQNKGKPNVRRAIQDWFDERYPPEPE
jgi:phage terminase small subunit